MKDECININSKYSILIKVILILSCPFLTVLLSNRFEIYEILLGAILSFVIFLWLCLKKNNIKYIDKYKFLLSVIISLYMIKTFLGYASNNVLLIYKIVSKLISINFTVDMALKMLGLAALPTTIYFVYIFLDRIVPKIQIFFKELTKNEKLYLKAIFICSLLVSILITHYTTAFSKPTFNNKVQNYDVIYTSDSGALVNHNTYFDVSYYENDIRQSLFGIFSLPFSVPAKMLSELCFFFQNNYAYETVMTVIQFMLIAISTIMIGRMMQLKEKEKILLYLFFSCSFPCILFSILIEQYVISLFYLITALYIYTKNSYKINYFYVPAVGTMITSGIIFPTITKFKNLRQWLKNVFKCFCFYAAVLIIGGQLPQILNIQSQIKHLTTFTGQVVTFKSKVFQFTSFIKGIFIANPGKIDMIYNHPSYQLMQFESISIIGIIILILCILGYIMNKKMKFAKISILWILFSIVVLLLIGWGTAENGLILYGLYFSWAYLTLYFLFFKKIFKKDKLFIATILLSCIIMLYFNVNEFLEILKFAFKFY